MRLIDIREKNERNKFEKKVRSVYKDFSLDRLFEEFKKEKDMEIKNIIRSLMIEIKY